MPYAIQVYFRHHAAAPLRHRGLSFSSASQAIGEDTSDEWRMMSSIRMILFPVIYHCYVDNDDVYNDDDVYDDDDCHM